MKLTPKDAATPEIVALIPVRAGSKRIPNKNLRKLGGITLLERKIIQLQSAGIEKIFVGSDSQELLNLATKAGAIPIQRKPEACNEELSTANEMIRDFSSRVTGDIAIWAHCTNPFLYAEHYRSAIGKFLQEHRNPHSQYDSLITVYRVQGHMWTESHKPANYNPYGDTHPLAGSLPPVYFQDGGIFIQTLEMMRKNSYFFGGQPYLLEIDPYNSLDINSPRDLEVANALTEYMDRAHEFRS
ncbi:MAG: cytidylyltransferase domain-containing protein [Oligoflexia bacterium]